MSRLSRLAAWHGREGETSRGFERPALHTLLQDAAVALNFSLDPPQLLVQNAVRPLRCARGVVSGGGVPGAKRILAHVPPLTLLRCTTAHSRRHARYNCTHPHPPFGRTPLPPGAGAMAVAHRRSRVRFCAPGAAGHAPRVPPNPARASARTHGHSQTEAKTVADLPLRMRHARLPARRDGATTGERALARHDLH